MRKFDLWSKREICMFPHVRYVKFQKCSQWYFVQLLVRTNSISTSMICTLKLGETGKLIKRG